MPSLPAASPALTRLLGSRATNDSGLVTHDSWLGAVWTVVIALDLFWLSNPLVFFTFEASLRNACAITLLATLLVPLRRGIAVPWAVAALLAYGLLSSLWSSYSILTVKFDLLYVATAAVALAVAATVNARTIAQGMLLGGVVYVAISMYAFWVKLPYAVSEFEPTFPAGVGSNRNIMSYTLVLSLAFALAVVPRTWFGRGAWLAGLGVVIYGLYLSQSATGVVSAVLVVGTAVALAWRDRPTSRTGRRARRLRRRWGWLFPLLVVVAAVAALREVLQLSGRDGATLSGRTPLWSATWTALDWGQAIVGSGWGTVWQHPWLEAGPNALHTRIIELNGGVFQPHGHNSFFDVLPELGLVGVALVAAIHVQVIGQGLALRRPAAVVATAEKLDASRIALVGVLALLVYGLTEPMSSSPLGWFALVLLAAATTAPAPRPDDRTDPAAAEPDGELGQRDDTGVDPDRADDARC
jgi:hypothetical protein